MNIKIKTIKDRFVWDNFIKEVKPNTFLHSWEWGQFNEEMKGKIYRLGAFDNEELISVALIIKTDARRGSFIFCPHGPIIKISKVENLIDEVLSKLTDKLKEIANNEGCSFIRISSLLTDTPNNRKIFKNLGFINAPIHMHPEKAWVIDINKSEEAILKDMRKTTRQLIKKAEQEGVQIEILMSEKNAVQRFEKIYETTSERQGFTPFSDKYIENEFKVFSQNNKSEILIAKYKNQDLSGAFIIFDENGAYYHHGASNQNFPKIPASHLLQWKIIQEARRRNCKKYNLWGIAPNNKNNHPWKGLTLFKTGFGGYSEDYVPAQDLPINSKYWLNYFVESLRRIKRGL
ncbi:MAG TPA: peptidoglycan bridge formation glycyltransferase FemA/FemB family protein [Candidatus Paceibacterota bacterium]